MPKVHKKNRSKNAASQTQEGVKPVIQPANHGGHFLISMHETSKTLADDIIKNVNKEAGNIAHVYGKLEYAGELCSELLDAIRTFNPGHTSDDKEDRYLKIRKDLLTVSALLDSSVPELDACDLGGIKRIANQLRLNLYSTCIY